MTVRGPARFLKAQASEVSLACQSLTRYYPGTATLHMNGVVPPRGLTGGVNRAGERREGLSRGSRINIPLLPLLRAFLVFLLVPWFFYLEVTIFIKLKQQRNISSPFFHKHQQQPLTCAAILAPAVLAALALAAPRTPNRLISLGMSSHCIPSSTHPPGIQLTTFTSQPLLRLFRLAYIDRHFLPCAKPKENLHQKKKNIVRMA